MKWKNLLFSACVFGVIAGIVLGLLSEIHSWDAVGENRRTPPLSAVCDRADCSMSKKE